jgi:hypothetical protein
VAKQVTMTMMDGPPNDGSFTQANHSPAMGLKQWIDSGLFVDVEAYLFPLRTRFG